MTDASILIVSGSGDGINYGRVSEILSARGHTVTVFMPDAVARGTQPFCLNLKPDGSTVFSYDNKPFDPTAFTAAWSRRPHFYGSPKDKLRWLTIKDEYAVLFDTLDQLIPETIWLNAPARMRAASHKLPQLQSAVKAGFTIPDTTVTNQWTNLQTLDAETLVVKFANNILLAAPEGEKVMPTTLYKKEALPTQALPYPGIWQTYQPKKREWRVTIVGKAVFGVAVYTDDNAKDDWRRHQFSGGTTFKAEPFPKQYHAACFKLLDHYGLRYGAFDFIETPEGEMIFLEVNVNGQFMWLEKELGLPISEAIADELETISKATLL